MVRVDPFMHYPDHHFHPYLLYAHISVLTLSSLLSVSSFSLSVLSTLSYPFHLHPLSSLYLLISLVFHLFLLSSSISLYLLQPAPASAVGDESEEDQKFRTIFQEIAGDVSEGVLCVYVSLCSPVLPECGCFCKPSAGGLNPLCLPGDGDHSQRAEEPAQQSRLQE